MFLKVGLIKIVLHGPPPLTVALQELSPQIHQMETIHNLNSFEAVRPIFTEDYLIVVFLFLTLKRPTAPTKIYCEHPL